MTDLLKSMLGGLARFVLAWLLPTAIGVGLFWAICIPDLVAADAASALTGAGSGAPDRGPLEALGIASFATLAISTVLAYGSQLIYRILEGYHLPRSVHRRWTRTQRRRHARLRATVDRLDATKSGSRSKQYGLALEQLGLYPYSVENVMPTRLGNALKTLEGYGYDRFGLDSQQFWFELVGTANDSVRREMEEARAQVDCFVAGVTTFSILATLSASVGIAVSRGGSLALSVASMLVVPLAYRGAVRNMKDWVNSIRALVNLGRYPLAEAMGLEMPNSHDAEQEMWTCASAVLLYRRDRWRPHLDVFRRGKSYPTSDLDIGASTASLE